jgi:hypothetical protein
MKSLFLSLFLVVGCINPSEIDTQDIDVSFLSVMGRLETYGVPFYELPEQEVFTAMDLPEMCDMLAMHDELVSMDESLSPAQKAVFLYSSKALKEVFECQQK